MNPLRPRTMSRARRKATAIGLTATAGAALFAALPAGVAFAATDLQGESLTVPSGKGSPYADGKASGGKALALWNNTTATGSFTAASKFTQLRVTAMGSGACGTTDALPRMKVALDGKTVSPSTTVSAKSWTDYVFYTAGSWAAGKHTVAVSFLNEGGTAKCDRFVEIDKISVPTTAAPAPTTPAATKPGTTSPTKAPTTAPTKAPTTTPTKAPTTAPTTAAPNPPASNSGFVTRSGSTLMLGGKQWKYAGLNAFGMTGCEGTPWSDAQLNDYFSRLSAGTVTRTWAFKPFGTAALDRIVTAAAKYNQKVIFSLADGRNYCGEWDGAARTEGGDKTVAWYQSGFRTNYIPWVKTVVARYAANPTVAMWEMINEPGSFDNAAYTDALIKGFFDETAAVIKGIDRNHLVATGTLSEDMYGTRDYAYVHSGANIDVASLHEYEYDWNNSNSIVTGHFGKVQTMLKSVNKPIIIGETGIQAGSSSCRTSTTARANAIQQKFNGYLNGGAAGVNIWSVVQYDPISSSEPCPLEMRVTDPIMNTVKNAQAALNK